MSKEIVLGIPEFIKKPKKYIRIAEDEFNAILSIHQAELKHVYNTGRIQTIAGFITGITCGIMLMLFILG